MKGCGRALALRERRLRPCRSGVGGFFVGVGVCFARPDGVFTGVLRVGFTFSAALTRAISSSRNFQHNWRFGFCAAMRRCSASRASGAGRGCGPWCRPPWAGGSLRRAVRGRQQVQLRGRCGLPNNEMPPAGRRARRRTYRWDAGESALSDAARRCGSHFKAKRGDAKACP